jgi:hypothetical protein
MIGSALFATDRFGVANSSLEIKANYPNYLSVPPGIYFSGALTVTFWIYLKSYSSSYFSYVFNFGNGAFYFENEGDIGLCFYPMRGFLRFELPGKSANSNSEIPINKWTHVAVTYNGLNTFIFYINGTVDSVEYRDGRGYYDSLDMRPKINTSKYYIGSSISEYYQEHEPNKNLDGLIDDLKFYDRVLDNLEVVEDMSLIFWGMHFFFYFIQKYTYDPRRTSKIS